MTYETEASYALVYFDREAEDKHKLWVNSLRLLGRRISLKNQNLSEAKLRGSELSGARFIHCNFSKSFFDRVDLVSAEIDDCVFNESGSYGSRYDNALIKNCQFIKTQYKLSKFISASIKDCSWRDSNCTVTTWNNAKVSNCYFPGVEFERSRFHKAHFENCDFSNTRLRAVEAYGTTFKNCDFRHADLNGFILQDTTFINCGFYGCQNKPDMQGKVLITNPDPSENYDGSQIVNESSVIHEWF
jgi:uncharacterized protein YjbI with pentapeptide repeats